MGLDVLTIPLQLVQTWFYLHYAELTGYELNLTRDVVGNQLDETKTYMYDENERGLRMAEQGDINANHIKFLRIVATRPIQTIAQIGGIEDVLADCWIIARQQAAI